MHSYICFENLKYYNSKLRWNPANSNLDTSNSPVTWTRSQFPWLHFLVIYYQQTQTPTNSNHFIPWEF